MMDFEERRDYDRFYNYLWNHLITLADVSITFREENVDLIDELTYIYFMECNRSNISEEVASRLIKSTLFSIEKNKTDFTVLYS